MVGGVSTSATTELDAMESTDVGEGVSVSVAGHRHPGQRIGPYEVECTIGAGAMGVVYAAVEPGTRRRLAVKLMHPRGAYAGGLSHRADAWLRNEARILSRLSHPNVVRVYGVGSDHGRPYMAMELVEGRTLGAWLAEEDHGWEETLRVCLEAARGVAAAHRAGIVHGDLKPDNVMVATDGRVIVMDFGLAQSMTRRARASTETAIPALPDDDATGRHAHFERDPDEEEDATQRSRAATGSDVAAYDDAPSVELPYDPYDPDDAPSMDARMDGLDDVSEEAPRNTDRLKRKPGTPAYMAPELLAGLGGDARSDQFSLCVTMYKALFGRRPYGGRTPTEIAFRVARNDLRRAPTDREVPNWVHARVTRGLALEPGDRWSSVEALIASLERGVQTRRRQRSTVAVACVMAGVIAMLALRWLIAGM